MGSNKEIDETINQTLEEEKPEKLTPKELLIYRIIWGFIALWFIFASTTIFGFILKKFFEFTF